MKYYVLKLKNSDAYVDGYRNYKISFANSLMNAMMFYSMTFITEFIEKYGKNRELEIYEIVLKKV